MTTATKSGSPVREMLADLSEDWYGPDSVMPNDRVVGLATQAEEVLAGASGLRALPIPGGGIGLRWDNDGLREELDIENDDPVMTLCSLAPGPVMVRQAESSALLELISAR